MADKHPVDSMNFLYDIMNDLYGNIAKGNAELSRQLSGDSGSVKPLTAEETEQLAEAIRATAAAAPAAPKASEPAEPAAPEKPAVPELPPFDTFWRTADDTVDWTDALAHRDPTDDLTDPDLWSFYHDQAEKILDGSLSAYVAVLKRANPLDDLVPYAAGFHVKAVDADTLSVAFETLPDYMKNSDTETRRYLSGISLRAARDLLALLPVYSVQVHVTTMGLPSLDVTYTRPEVQKVRFSLVDPVDFCLKCGGEFKE